MKRTILALAIAFVCTVPRGAHAATASPPNIPNGGQHTNPSFIGAGVYRIEVSTPVDTAVLLASGQGVLYGIDCSSGTTSGFAIAYDSATSSGITFTSTGKAISPSVFSNGNSASNVTTAGWDTHGVPVQFNNGLVALTHGVAVNCLLKARLTSVGASQPNAGP
jgi:hypothetical protein